MALMLHIGCGGARHKHRLFTDYDEVRMDLEAQPSVQVIGDASKLPFADESFDGVQSFHVMEHLHPHDFEKALREAYRVLASEGILAFVVPDFEFACQWIADGKEEEPVYHATGGPIYASDMIYGWDRLTAITQAQVHRSGLTPKRIARDMKTAGFEDVRLSRLEGRYEIEAIGRRA
jgi:ubiquinone/menaquinone biosynthesis C-methylase UbiE